MSFGMIVTLFAWMAQRLVSSNRPTSRPLLLPAVQALHGFGIVDQSAFTKKKKKT
jgi:hypothetical protein